MVSSSIDPSPLPLAAAWPTITQFWQMLRFPKEMCFAVNADHCPDKFVLIMKMDIVNSLNGLEMISTWWLWSISPCNFLSYSEPNLTYFTHSEKRRIMLCSVDVVHMANTYWELVWILWHDLWTGNYCLHKSWKLFCKLG